MDEVKEERVKKWEGMKKKGEGSELIYEWKREWKRKVDWMKKKDGGKVKEIMKEQRIEGKR